MRTFFILILLSVIGIGIAVGTTYYADFEHSGDNVAIPSMKLPYKKFIAGTGIVESRGKNIFVGSQLNGIVKKVYVQSAESIQKGELLFELDDTKQKAQIPILEAAIKASQAKYLSAKHQLDILNKMKKLSSNMVTNEKYTKALDAFNEAKEVLLLSKSRLTAAQKELLLYKIYAPISGKVLRSNITEGSFFEANAKAVVIGSDALSVKVSINEFDSWKFEPKSDAVAFVRGNPAQKIDLEYAYTIPYIIPKKNLTGLSTEQTDTRVLQVVYNVKNSVDFPLYVGEMLDIFVKTSKGN
jgi:multidrug efflux pump subunit AcrA (membrane-fusion protein)